MIHKLVKILSEDKLYQIFLLRKFGERKNATNLLEWREKCNELEPIFFLSTGRCGTKWINEILKLDQNTLPVHHPIPVMRSQAKIAYEYSYANSNDREKNLLKEMYLGGREELFHNAYRANKNVIFTDSRATFFAYVIKDIFPKSKFIHLHRDPGEVIRSGLRRNWYDSNNQSELNRITPLKSDSFYANWGNATLIEKNAWLWKETNEWIFNFMKHVQDDRKLTLSFNDWNTDILYSSFQFCNTKISKSEIENRLNKKTNVQKSGNILRFNAWHEKDQNDVRKIVNKIAQQLNYQL